MINNSWMVLLNTSGVFLMILAAAAYFLLVERNRGEVVKFLVTVGLAGFFAFVLKELFNEPRPFVVESTKPLAGLAMLSSFPSLHSALAFSAATKVTFRRRFLGIVFLMLAFFVGLGRVLARVHYPIDILIGVVVGVSAAGVVESFLGKK